jgi:hypothetical protein
VPLVPLEVPLALTVAGLYFLFLLYRSCRLWQAWRKAGAIRRASSPVEFSAPLEAVVRRYRDELGVGRGDIRVSSTDRGAGGDVGRGVRA